MMLECLIGIDSRMMEMRTEYIGSSLEIKMRICMKANGLIIKRMAEVCRYIQMEPDSMDGGKPE